MFKSAWEDMKDKTIPKNEYPLSKQRQGCEKINVSLILPLDKVTKCDVLIYTYVPLIMDGIKMMRNDSFMIIYTLSCLKVQYVHYV